MINSHTLVLGCARFSGYYGVGSKYKVSKKEVKKILLCGKKYINEIDTAISYKDANEKLKKINLKNFLINTKIPNYNINNNYEINVIKNIIVHLNQLNINSFETIYLHNPKQLLKKNSKIIINTLENLKKMGLTKRIGISVYNPKELIKILKYYKPDVVQFPLNVFDRRFLEKKIIKIIKKNKIIPYVRSIFLQGILLKDFSKLPKFFFRWSNKFKQYEKWLKNKKISRVEGGLSILNSIPFKTKVIIGVENYKQLKQIIKKSNTKIIPNISLGSKDYRLLNPYLWSI